MQPPLRTPADPADTTVLEFRPDGLPQLLCIIITGGLFFYTWWKATHPEQEEEENEQDLA